MIGAIAGDMIGAPYERSHIKSKNFEIAVSGFTDDTVLTVAVADAILNKGDFTQTIKRYAQKYHDRGYGGIFRKWMLSWEDEPYGSFGNGSAMRVSPVGFAFDTVEDVLLYAKQSAEVTHNHPEGIKGAQATALAVFMARNNESKEAIRHEIANRFGYDMERTVDDIRPGYRFDVSCQGSVPESIIPFIGAPHSASVQSDTTGCPPIDPFERCGTGKHGAKWTPEGRYEFNDARRFLLKMKVDYTVEFVWIMSKYKSCSRTALEQFLKTPTIRKHLADQLPRINELLNEFSQDKIAAD